MNITVNRELKMPIYMQIYTQIRTMIIKGEIANGFILPSERTLAKELSVHRNTIIRAYNELEDKGLIRSRQGVGYKVEYGAETGRKKRGYGLVNWSSTIKAEYLDMEKTFDDLFSKSYSDDVISFAGGMSSPTVYEKETIAEGLAEVLSAASKRSYFYTPYQGIYSLRKQLAAFVREKGILAGPSEIQILSEANQAWDYIFTLILNSGDKVITEEPVSPDIYRAVRLAGGEVVSVPVDRHGMMCDNLEALIEKEKPKIIYVNSSYQDPMGVIMSIERRKKLLALSSKYRIPIVEDDASSEINFSGEVFPRLKALDKGNNVIYIYSFAMTLIPGMNIAFTVAPKQVIDSMSYLMSIKMISADWIMQELLEYYLKSGIYKKNVEKLTEEYRHKRDIMCSIIDQASHLGIKYEKPKGGVYLWCSLPPQAEAGELLRESVKKGIAFVPGSVFFPCKQQNGNFIRLNYSRPSVSEIEKGMKLLIEIIEQKVLVPQK